MGEDDRLSLSEAERALLPEHPAVPIELSDAAMEGVAGGVGPLPSSGWGATNTIPIKTKFGVHTNNTLSQPSPTHFTPPPGRRENTGWLPLPDKGGEVRRWC